MTPFSHGTWVAMIERMRILVACALSIVACGGQIDGPSPSPRPSPVRPTETSYCKPGDFYKEAALPAKILLTSKTAGDAPLDVTIQACFRPNGMFAATVGSAAASFQLPGNFERGNVFFVTSPGNRLLSDDDLRYFSALDSVRVRRL